jgi:hypothetical protein
VRIILAILTWRAVGIESAVAGHFFTLVSHNFCKPASSHQKRSPTHTTTMSLTEQRPMATAAAVAAPGLLTQIGMAGSSAVITVTFIHPIDVVVRFCMTVSLLHGLMIFTSHISLSQFLLSHRKHVFRLEMDQWELSVPPDRL